MSFIKLRFANKKAQIAQFKLWKDKLTSPKAPRSFFLEKFDFSKNLFLNAIERQNIGYISGIFFVGGDPSKEGGGRGEISTSAKKM